MRYIPKQLIQLPHTLLDIPYLALPLNDQRFLEVDFVLRCEAEGLLLLELLRLARGRWVVGVAGQGRGVGVVDGGARGGGNGALLFDGKALDGLEFGARGLEFAGEFLLGVFLGGLEDRP